MCLLSVSCAKIPLRTSISTLQIGQTTNLLIYLNERWEEDWGGEFGLYDREGKICIKKVPPLFNRCVIFDSHDYSFHGLPDPINFPDSVDRKSIILLTA